MPTSGESGTNKPTANRKGAAQESAEPLGADAARWLNDLPESVRPMKTCARYPRIVNRLASVWDKPTHCGSYFNELLLDGRGDRQGFPLDIAFELAALKNYFETAVHPSHQTIWDDIIKRARDKA